MFAHCRTVLPVPLHEKATRTLSSPRLQCGETGTSVRRGRRQSGPELGKGATHISPVALHKERARHDEISTTVPLDK